MADLQDLSGDAGAAGLRCDRAIFTSLPSPTGEGYRLVAWSAGVRPEERIELTRRAPSHGSLCGEAPSSRGTVLCRLQSSGRVVHGFVRVSGAEHTRRGGGRVWTDFLLSGPSESAMEGHHPCRFRDALVVQPAPKAPIGGAPLAPVVVSRSVASDPRPPGLAGIAMAAAVASSLVDGRVRVIAVGSTSLDVFEDALRMLPASLRTGLEACGGLRYTSARGVKTTVTDRIDPDTVRATRGQGIECVDLEARPRDAAGPLAPWLRLMSRWWGEDRAGEAVELADRLAGGWSTEEVVQVAMLAEAVDRGEARPDALEARLHRRTAA